ncbi:MAG: ABC transporter permease [Oscillospiraceae bacterium]|nr:ABC transporter permease [Oscillospiraceae bacterium]
MAYRTSKRIQRVPSHELDISAPRSMRRAGTGTKLLLTAFSAALIYLAYVLVSQSAAYMTKSGKTTYGKVLDRKGDVLFDGTQPLSNYPWGQFADVGNFIGDTSGQMTNTIVARNSSLLANYSFSYGNDGTTVLETSLSHAANRAVYNAFGSKNGTAIAYNWQTGELLVCVSKPCVDITKGYADIDTMPSGSLLCKAFYPTVPGSTQKVSTLLAAYQYAGAETINALEYNCTGEWTNATGDVIKCHQSYGHGNQNLVTAFANSCNPYFAQLVQSDIVPLNDIINAYARMGYSVNDSPAESLEMNGIVIPPASTVLRDSHQFETQWGALGQGRTLVSPYQLMLWQGAIANGTGCAVQPGLLTAVTKSGGTKHSLQSHKLTDQMFSSAAAQSIQKVMTQNVQYNYGALQPYNCGVKSGTAQVNDNGRQYENSLLTGFSLDEQCPVAFCIMIEERESWDVSTGQIASVLLSTLKENL